MNMLAMFLDKPNSKGRIFGLDHKNSSLAFGLIAFLLIVQGSINILNSPLFSVFEIAFAFIIMLPLSWYNMRESEKVENVGKAVFE